MGELHHFIGGKKVKGASKRFGDVYWPMTGEIAARCPLASRSEVRAAVENAKAAQPGWAATNPQVRARVLMRFLALVQRDMEEIALDLAREHGKVLADAKGDIQRGLEVVEFACGIPHLMKGEYTEGAGPGIDVYSMRQPLGVVAGITPFNFPAMIPMWKLAPAIACGNAFILKPSERDPSVPLRIAELMMDAGLPAGILNVVNGDKEAVDAILDDPDIQADLRRALEASGFAVDWVRDGPQAASAMGGAAPYDAVVLDLGLPDGDGIALLAELRHWSGMPVLVLSARSDEADKVAALDAGADDYLAKPFGVGELLARVRALLRRAMRPPQAMAKVGFGEVEVDLEQRPVTRAGQPVHLTPIEYRLLSLLIAGGGRMVTQRQLLAGAWGPNHVEHAHYLRVYMAGLRRKLERDPRLPAHILTEPGVGYRLVPEPLSAARTPASAPPAG